MVFCNAEYCQSHLTELRTSSATLPAFPYASSSFSVSAVVALAIMAPAIISTGMAANITRVNSHPKMKAVMMELTNTDMKNMNMPTFSPIPSWSLLRSLKEVVSILFCVGKYLCLKPFLAR